MPLLFDNTPSPMVTGGNPVANPIPTKTVPYNGLPLTRILLSNAQNPFTFRQLLRRSRVGSAFDLQYGDPLVIERKTENFARHSSV